MTCVILHVAPTTYSGIELLKLSNQHTNFVKVRTIIAR